MVVMLCRIQPGFTGCSQYFPDREFSGQLKHGDFQVETLRAVSHRSTVTTVTGSKVTSLCSGRRQLNMRGSS